jgi:hypothetical protein
MRNSRSSSAGGLRGVEPVRTAREGVGLGGG